MSIVFICNKGDAAHEDGFNGERFKFPIGETVPVPLIAARHMFGYGDSDKAPYLARIGRMKSKTGLEEGMKWLSNFVFSEPDEPAIPDLNAPDEPPVRARRAKSAASEEVTAE